MPIAFAARIYFDRAPLPLANYHELDRRLRNGELRFAMEIPPGFQKDLQRGRQPEVNVVSSMLPIPFRAETRAQLCRKRS